MKLPHIPAARPRVLVVEDSSVFREMQALLLRQAGFGVWSFESPAAALNEATNQHFELALVDYELPGMNGGQFMQALRELQPGIPVIFVSGSLTLDLVGALTRQGAAGIFSKPTNPKVLLEKIRETLNRIAGAAELRAGPDLQTGISHIPFPMPEPAVDRLAYEPRYVYGASDTFRHFTHQLWRARDFRSMLLLQGETGSPFELIARELMGISVFRAAPVMICEPGEFESNRLSEILAPSLLTPEAGTLVVEGVDEFSTAQQALLLDLCSVSGMFLPFARRFRLLLTATAQLAARVESGAFDEALYYKLSSLTLTIPTLAAMRGDIAVNSLRLLQHLQNTVNPQCPVALTDEAADWLENQPWPGNYEQLAHTLYFAARQTSGSQLDVSALEAGALDCTAATLMRSTNPTTPLLSVPRIEADVDAPSPTTAAKLPWQSASPLPR